MNRSPRQTRSLSRPTLRASLLLLVFGLAALAFLAWNDRAHWFEVRPASGTAAAMWHASDTNGATAQH